MHCISIFDPVRLKHLILTLSHTMHSLLFLLLQHFLACSITLKFYILPFMEHKIYDIKCSIMCPFYAMSESQTQVTKTSGPYITERLGLLIKFSNQTTQMKELAANSLFCKLRNSLCPNGLGKWLGRNEGVLENGGNWRHCNNFSTAARKHRGYSEYGNSAFSAGKVNIRYRKLTCILGLPDKRSVVLFYNKFVNTRLNRL